MASNKAQKIREEAIKLFSKGKWDKALSAYMKLTKVEPREPKNFQKVAELQLKLDMKKQAVETYKRACDQFMSNGFLIQAIAICKIVIQLAPEEKDMEDKLSELYAKRGIGGPGKPPPSPVRKPAPKAPTRPAPAAQRPKPEPEPEAPEPEPEASPPEPEPVADQTDAIELEPPEDTDSGMVLENTSYGEVDLQAEGDTTSDGIELAAEDDIPAEVPLDDGSDEDAMPDLAEESGIELEAEDEPALADDGGIDIDVGEEPDASEESKIDLEEADDGIEIDMGLDDDAAMVSEEESEEEIPVEAGDGDDSGALDLSEETGDIEGDGIEIDVMGDIEEEAEEKEEIEEEKTAAAPVFDLSSEMDSGESIEDIIDDWGDEEEDVSEPEDAPGGIIEEEDIEDVTFFPEIPLFSDLSQDEFREIVRKLKAASHLKGGTIIKEGDQGDSIMIIASGSVEVYKDAPDDRKVLVATLSEGSFFGEFGYFAYSKRQASVVAAEDSELLEITREDMEDVVRKFPGVEQVLEKFYRGRVIENILATSGLFMELDAGQREKLASQFKLEEFRENSDIVVEGEDADKMYLIRSGNVLVHTKNPMGDKVSLAELGPGDFFGEIGVIEGKPRTATVTAVSPMVEAMSLDKADLDNIISEFPAIGEKINEVIEARTEDTVNKVSFLDLDDDDLEIGSLL